MKKIAILLIAFSLISLTGCKQSESEKQPPISKTTEEEIKEFPIDIPTDHSDPLFYDGLDQALETLMELEG